jgi:hypothetical protein
MATISGIPLLVVSYLFWDRYRINRKIDEEFLTVRLVTSSLACLIFFGIAIANIIQALMG